MIPRATSPGFLPHLIGTDRYAQCLLLSGCMLLMSACETSPRVTSTYNARRMGLVDKLASREMPPPALPPEPVEPLFQPNDRIHVHFVSGKSAGGKYFLENGDVVYLDFAFDGSDYRLLPGDELKVDFGAESKLDFSVTVRPDGKVTLPEQGEVQATGLTAAGLAEAIDKKFVERLRNPDCTVTVQRTNVAMIAPLRGGFLIRHDGAIALPFLGEIPAAGQTPSDLAATISILASKHFQNGLSFFVTSQVPEVNRAAPKTSLIGFEQTLTISPEGYIVLPELGAIKAAGRTFEALRADLNNQLRQRYANAVDVALTLISSENRVVYVQGEVGRSGTFPLTAGLTMLKALTLAGGANDQANLKEVVLIHYKSATEVVIYKANLKAILSQKQPVKDVLLSPQDVIYVPKSGVAKANLFIDQYITRMLPFSRGVNYTYSDIPNTATAPAAAVSTSTP